MTGDVSRTAPARVDLVGGSGCSTSDELCLIDDGPLPFGETGAKDAAGRGNDRSDASESLYCTDPVESPLDELCLVNIRPLRSGVFGAKGAECADRTDAGGCRPVRNVLRLIRLFAVRLHFRSPLACAARQASDLR